MRRAASILALTAFSIAVPGCLGESWCDLQHSTCIGLQGITVEAQFTGQGNSTHAAQAFQKMGFPTTERPQGHEAFVEWNGTWLQISPRYDQNETWFLKADLQTPGLSRYESLEQATTDAQAIWTHTAHTYIPFLDRFSTVSGWTRTSLEIRPYGYIK